MPSTQTEKADKIHVWLRAETKPHEARTALTPKACQELLKAGVQVTVEESSQRIFSDDEYRAVGCSLVTGGTWKDAPKSAFIFGLKELPEEDCPLVHRHCFFGHVYKQQEGWEILLKRFKDGGGILLDVEYMVDENGRRAVAEFGPMAGMAGLLIGVDLWCHQHLKKGQEYGAVSPFPSETDFVEHVRSHLDQVYGSWSEVDKNESPKVMIMGALGRCGQGALYMLEDKLKIPSSQIAKWDLKETAGGGPFPEILSYDVFVNCINLNTLKTAIPPFLTKDMLGDGNRKLSVVVDVSCDVSNPNNPLPFVTDITTFSKPVRHIEVSGSSNTLDIIAIDHLPSLLPRESSIRFSEKMLPFIFELSDLSKSTVWSETKKVFDEKIKLV